MTVLHTQDGLPVAASNRLPVELYGADGAPLLARRLAADNLALPTAPDVLATLLGRDPGGLLDLLRTASPAGAQLTDGALAVVPHAWDSVSSRFLPAAAAANDAVSRFFVPLTLPGTYNPATDAVDRQRGNHDVTALVSAARTGSTQSADLTNHNCKGAIVFLNVTANPGGAETLLIQAQVKDALGNVYHTYAATPASNFGGGPGAIALAMHPGGATAGTGGVTTAQLALPRTWRVNVVHSAAGSWTYSVGVAYLR